MPGLPREATAPRPGRKRALMLASAVLAIAAVIAAVMPALLLTGGEEEAVVGDDWTRAPHNESVFGGSLGTHAVRIVGGESGFVAAGGDGHFPADQLDIAVWTSPDGRDWSRVSDPDLSGPLSQSAFGLVTGSAGFMAVGTEFHDQGRLFTAAVWRSPDGMSWERVSGNEEAFGGGVMRDVAVRGAGYVAVGVGEGVGAVWTSSDGANWSRVSSHPAVFAPRAPTENPAMFMLGVAVAEDGRVAAVGHDLDFPENGSPAGVGVAWVSADGTSWSRSPHDDAVFGDGSTALSLDAIAAGGPGFVAVGSEYEGGVETFVNQVLEDAGPKAMRAVVLTTEDGIVWSRAPASAATRKGGRTFSYSDITSETGPVSWRSAGDESI